MITLAGSVADGMRKEILDEVAIPVFAAPCSADAVDEIVTRVMRESRVRASLREARRPESKPSQLHGRS